MKRVGCYLIFNTFTAEDAHQRQCMIFQCAVYGHQRPTLVISMLPYPIKLWDCSFVRDNQ